MSSGPVQSPPPPQLRVQALKRQLLWEGRLPGEVEGSDSQLAGPPLVETVKAHGGLKAPCCCSQTAVSLRPTSRLFVGKCSYRANFYTHVPYVII